MQQVILKLVAVSVTASHNPINFNGMKIVGRCSRPIDKETELKSIRKRQNQANLNRILILVLI